MTLISARGYRLLRWLLPLLVIFGARDLVWTRAEGAYSHFISTRSLSERIRKTGIHIRELPEMKSDYERLVRKKTEISSSLFGARSEANLYELLVLKARESGVSIISVTPRPQRSDAGFIELPLMLEAGGSFDNLARFISQIENVNRLMRVEELAMSKDRAGILTVALKLLVFMYSDSLGSSTAAKSGIVSTFQKREQYLSELQKALGARISPLSPSFRETGRGDPFGASAPERTGPPAKAAAVPKGPPGISLKGILWKDPPLAILETLDGRTYIVKRGDSVNEFTVTSITRTEIAVSSGQGTNVLHLYTDK